MSELPLAGTGKIDRRRLTARARWPLARAAGPAMRAVIIREHGGPRPPRPRRALPRSAPRARARSSWRVRATSLNYHDVFTLRGMPGIKIPMPAIMGLDVAGEVDEVGPGVEGWRLGDRVLVDPIDRERGGLMGETIHGGLAERCRAGAHQLIRIPDGVSFADAAALPVAYGTAHRMMVTQGRVAAGERVLILGASGGVGTCCVFLAKMAGATVVACASSEDKLKRLYELGADHVIDYARGDFMARGPRALRQAAAAGASTAASTWSSTSLAATPGCRRCAACAAAGGCSRAAPPPASIRTTDIRYIWTFELQVLGSNGWTPDDLVTLLEHGRRAAGCSR